MRNRSAFAKALLDPAARIPRGLCARQGSSAANRFAIYRNNAVSGLIDALQESFPATLRIVGEDFFRAMARVHVLQAPPRSAVLRHFAQGFPDFLDAFPPARDIPYLADVARLEAARIEAFHAADPSSDPEVWARGMRGDISHARIALHPSARILRSAHPVVTIWRMNASDGIVSAIDDWIAEDALVHRDPDDAVCVERLPFGVAPFLKYVQNGSLLGAAARAAIETSPTFDLTGALALLMRTGATIHAVTGDQP